MDHQAKFLFKPLQPVPPPPACPFNATLYPTPYPGFFLTLKSGRKYRVFDSDNRHGDATVQALVDYTLHTTQSQLSQVLQSNKKKLCHTQLHRKDLQHHHLRGNLFAQRVGDLIFLYECENKTATIENRDRCYADVPIKGGFIDPISRISKSTSYPAYCNPQFPLTVRTSTNMWVELAPSVQTVAAPKSRNISTLSFVYNPLKDGGPFKEEQWKQWYLRLEQNSYSAAVLGTLIYGAEVHTRRFTASNNSLDYDINRLTPAQDLLSHFNTIDNFVVRWSGWLAALVLILKLGKIGITTSLLTQSLIMDGPSGALC